MKILGGKFKGRNFYMPAGIRPTQDMTRKAVVDLIGHDLTGLEVLDLFAGSGSVGLEMLSRGAKRALFVEHDSKCASTIVENLRRLDLYDGTPGQQAELIQSDAFMTIKRLAQRGQKFDLIFLDPPYGLDLAKKALKTLTGYDILQPNCLVIVEHSKLDRLGTFDETLSVVTERKYGATYLTIFKALKS